MNYETNFISRLAQMAKLFQILADLCLWVGFLGILIFGIEKNEFAITVSVSVLFISIPLSILNLIATKIQLNLKESGVIFNRQLFRLSGKEKFLVILSLILLMTVILGFYFTEIFEKLSGLPMQYERSPKYWIGK